MASECPAPEDHEIAKRAREALVGARALGPWLEEDELAVLVHGGAYAAIKSIVGEEE